MALDYTGVAFATQYDAFKNHLKTTAQVSISGTIAVGDALQVSTSVDLEQPDVITQVYMVSSYEPTRTYILNHRTTPGRLDGGGRLYNLEFAFSVNNNTLTITVVVVNPYGTALTINSETLTFTVWAFISPF